jgi:hypothetical protein
MYESAIFLYLFIVNLPFIMSFNDLKIPFIIPVFDGFNIHFLSLFSFSFSFIVFIFTFLFFLLSILIIGIFIYLTNNK